MNNKLIVGIIAIVVGGYLLIKSLPYIITLTSNLLSLSFMAIAAFAVIYLLARFLKGGKE